MKSFSQHKASMSERRGERGAAIVTVILFATLLLAAGGTLLLTTTMSALNAVDSTGEMQAYYGAEAGMQAVMSVLRGNVPPTVPGVTATFRNLKLNPTMALWLPYNATVGTTQVVAVNGAGAPFCAYRVTDVIDLDNTPAADEPARLLIRVTGYGPRQSIKMMEMVVNKGPFSLDPPAAITIIGAENGSSMQAGDFDIGDSSPRGYSGTDAATGSARVKATFGFTQQADRDLAECTFSPGCTLYSANPNPLYNNKSVSSTDNTPRARLVANNELPGWLRTANAARYFVSEVRAEAEDIHRSFTGAPPNGTSFGTVDNPVLTFVNGDFEFSGNGAGLLVVTGTLTLKGDFQYDGVILALGTGDIIRNGGGGGFIKGALVLADFPLNGNSGFQARPSFNTNGGGNSDIKYHSQNVAKAFETLGPMARAVRER